MLVSVAWCFDGGRSRRETAGSFFYHTQRHDKCGGVLPCFFFFLEEICGGGCDETLSKVARKVARLEAPRPLEVLRVAEGEDVDRLLAKARSPTDRVPSHRVIRSSARSSHRSFWFTLAKLYTLCYVEVPIRKRARKVWTVQGSVKMSLCTKLCYRSFEIRRFIKVSASAEAGRCLVGRYLRPRATSVHERISGPVFLGAG